MVALMGATPESVEENAENNSSRVKGYIKQVS